MAEVNRSAFIRDQLKESSSISYDDLRKKWRQDGLPVGLIPSESLFKKIKYSPNRKLTATSSSKKPKKRRKLAVTPVLTSVKADTSDILLSTYENLENELDNLIFQAKSLSTVSPMVVLKLQQARREVSYRIITSKK